MCYSLPTHQHQMLIQSNTKNAKHKITTHHVYALSIKTLWTFLTESSLYSKYFSFFPRPLPPHLSFSPGFSSFCYLWEVRFKIINAYLMMNVFRKGNSSFPVKTLKKAEKFFTYMQHRPMGHRNRLNIGMTFCKVTSKIKIPIKKIIHSISY